MRAILAPYIHRDIADRLGNDSTPEHNVTRKVLNHKGSQGDAINCINIAVKPDEAEYLIRTYGRGAVIFRPGKGERHPENLGSKPLGYIAAEIKRQRLG